MVTAAAKATPEKNAAGATLIGPLKDQIALLALLVTLAGLASTEAYYARFDLQYQFLGLPASHIVYRGIGIAWSHFYVALPYVLASAWLLIVASRPTPLRSERFQLVLTYLMILIVTVPTLTSQPGDPSASGNKNPAGLYPVSSRGEFPRGRKSSKGSDRESNILRSAESTLHVLDDLSRY